MVKYAKIEEEVVIPEDVEVSLDGKKLTLKGKKGSASNDFTHARQISFELENKTIHLSAQFPRRNTVALVYTIKNLINNMILGVQEGYTYKMKMVYSHFPITVEPPKKGSNIIAIKNFIGERAPRFTKAVGDVQIKATKEEVIITGCNKEHVGQTAANIQKRCRIKKKDKRVFQDGVYVYEKSLGDKVFWSIK